MLHVISFSVEEGVVGVIEILSTSTTSFVFSCPATVSRPLLGDSGAGLPLVCFSINRSSCIVEVFMITVVLALLPIDDFVVTDNVFEKRLAALKSPINHGGWSGKERGLGLRAADPRIASRPRPSSIDNFTKLGPASRPFDPLALPLSSGLVPR